MAEFKGAEFIKNSSLDELETYLKDKTRSQLPMDEQWALYERLRKNTGKTGTPTIIPLFQLIVRDSHGNVKHNTGLRPSYSSARNWWNRMAVLWSPKLQPKIAASQWADGYINFKTPLGTVAKASNSYQSDNPFTEYGYSGRSQTQSQGIWPGLGTTAESFGDFQLASRCNHGQATGLLYYYTTIMTNQFYGGSNPYRIIFWRRLFRNDGATLVVREAALAWSFEAGGVNNTGIIDFRDVLTTPATMIVSDWLDIKYAFRMDYPDGVGA